MKVKVWVEVAQEMDVEVTVEDITRAIQKDTDSLNSCLSGINAALCFLHAVPGGVLEQMTPAQRRIIAQNLDKQAARFAEGKRPTCSGCGNEIDPDTCWCGDLKEGHERVMEHPFIPMGCNCYRSDTKPLDFPRPRGADPLGAHPAPKESEDVNR
jgi:hypothetical protein